jgi:hypothetical protein
MLRTHCASDVMGFGAHDSVDNHYKIMPSVIPITHVPTVIKIKDKSWVLLNDMLPTTKYLPTQLKSVMYQELHVPNFIPETCLFAKN